MFEKFYPDMIVDSIQNIDLELLKKKHIKGLILDIDNTLVPHGREADEKAVMWVESVKKSGLNACIVSNASQQRVIKFNDRLKLFAIHRASKPGSKAFIKAMRYMNLQPNETAVVGDQIFTDVYGGNKVDMYTILVKPIDKREILFIKVKRLAERYVLSHYGRNFNKHSNKRQAWKRKSVARRLLHAKKRIK